MAGAVGLLAISMTITVVYHQSNKTLKTELKAERLKSESLLSEKLALDKELIKLQTDIQLWRGMSPKTDLLPKEANANIGSIEK